MKSYDALILILLRGLSPSLVSAFAAVRACRRSAARTVRQASVDMDTISDIGYTASVAKPLGVVFGENRAPFSGLSVDDVEDGMNGGVAGLKIGDQLLAVNGESLIGKDFDTAMTKLKDTPSPMELKLYRGSVSSLFTIVSNRRGADFVEEEGDDETEEIVFDENYESPVVMSAEDFGDDTISVSALAGDAAKSIGNIFGGGGGDKKGGFFGGMFSQETIQLEDKDGK